MFAAYRAPAELRAAFTFQCAAALAAQRRKVVFVRPEPFASTPPFRLAGVELSRQVMDNIRFV